MKYLLLSTTFFALASCSLFQESLSTLSRPTPQVVADQDCDPAARAERDSLNERLRLQPGAAGAMSEMTMIPTDASGMSEDLVCVSGDSGLVRCIGLPEGDPASARPEPALFDQFQRRQALLARLYACQG
jgi:hypothetical protein